MTRQSSAGHSSFYKWGALSAPIILLTVAFIVPLQHLFSLARRSDLYSHTLLVPLICLYLAWDTARSKSIEPSNPNRWLALAPACIGLISLAAFFLSNSASLDSDQIENYLSYSIFAYACFIIATCFSMLGRETVKAQIFPILFILFLAPFPVAVRESIQTFFQYTSAEVSYWFIKLAGIPIYREGLVFKMPTIAMEVAPECSGLRSSLVLFIVSTIASFLFLKSGWKRSVFVFLVIPIGILRNAIRILILALQCYHIGPEEIHGWFHRQGGQPLFAVTLIPLFATLYFFWRSERKPKVHRHN